MGALLSKTILVITLLLTTVGSRPLAASSLPESITAPLTAQVGKACAKAQRAIQTARETQATELNLQGFGLQTLPPEIGQLTQLKDSTWPETN
ncbi:MAG: hypothetical protein AAF959_23220 [Cyanobacteria bacterium P01_D01_bin.56]